MPQVSTNDFRQGLKILVDKQPYTIVANEFVKPGKGQAFSRVKIKHLLTARVIEKNFKSGEKFEVADALEADKRLLYTDSDEIVFMDDQNFEQVHVLLERAGETQKWLKEDLIYTLVFYNGEVVSIDPPNFMELEVTETTPGEKGNTAAGRVLKPATVETGAEVQIPIFIQQGEIIKVDTRTGEYASRVSK